MPDPARHPLIPAQTLEAATSTPSLATPSTAADGRNAILWPILLTLLLVWLAPLAGLAVHWDLNPEYHFGYFVPVLAAYAAWHRWKSRPHPGAAIRGTLGAIVLGVVAMLPLWVMAQPSPDWTLLNWTFTGLVAGITLAAVGAVGGWPWVKHFAFPVAIIFTAVPWPDFIESPLTQSLMRLVASVAVGVLDLLGVGALQHGNLIEVGTGTVGVDEACSGIRSLHGSLMASIVLGEFFRFNAARRIALVLTSLAVAFATNVFRASFLAWNAAHSGLGAVDRWHDSAGFTTLAFCIACILVTALILDRNSRALASPAVVSAGRALPRWFAPGICGWLVLCAAATAAWFHDSSPVPVGPLRAYPITGCERAKISSTALDSFRATESSAFHGSGSGASQWLLYFFHWDFGPSFSRVAASMHNPDLCLPAGGRELHEDRGEVTFTAAGREYPFRAYSFRDGQRLLFVYHGIWPFSSERAAGQRPLTRQKYLATWESIVRRERNMGQQSAELILSGHTSEAEADAVARDLIPRLLVPRVTPAHSS